MFANHMKKFLLSLFISLVIIPAGVLSVFYSLNENQFFNLEEVIVEVYEGDSGSPFLKPLIADIKMDLEKLKGQSLWDLSPDQISEEISSLDWIQTLRVSRKWPHTLRLEIHPKNIELVYLKASGEMYPIVSDGSFLKAVEPANSPDAAILQGHIFEEDLQMRQKAISAVREIPIEGKFSRKNISALHFDKKTGFWATLIESGMKVKIGEDRIALKAQRVSQVLEYMDSRGLEARVIDANLSKKVLVRLRKGP